jgi:hypothetical protein
MKAFCLVAVIVCMGSAGFCHGEVRLAAKSTAVFATVDKAAEILTTRDDFVERLSPFDRAARLKTDRAVSEEEYLKFVAQNVLAWPDAQKKTVESALQAIQPRLEALSLPFPKTVYLIRTTGKEEGGAAYTRGQAVVLPESELAAGPRALRKLISHELFHVLTRANPDLRERLYKTIGFEKCDEVEFPAGLKTRKITNPDAPRNDHCIRLQIGGKPVWAVPILFSAAGKYDVARGGEFFNYLQFRFLLVERSGDSMGVKAIYDGPEPRLADVRSATGFFEQVGRNTQYIIHPEEILADNFALLVLGETGVPSPVILQKMKDALTK